MFDLKGEEQYELTYKTKHTCRETDEEGQPLSGSFAKIFKRVENNRRALMRPKVHQWNQNKEEPIDMKQEESVLDLWQIRCQHCVVNQGEKYHTVT